MNDLSSHSGKIEPPRATPCLHPASQHKHLFSARDYITGDQFEIVHCQTCDLVVTTPEPRDWSRYYPAAYYGAQTGKRFPAAVEYLQDILYASRAKKVEQLNAGRTGRVLDVGCGRGLLLKQFKQRGWEVQGTELDEKSAAYPRDVLGLPVRTGELIGMNFPDAHFDAVVMWHVLEHVPAVPALLAEISRLLKPGGVFLVGVPNFGSFESRVAKSGWFHLDVPRHLNHFTQTVLLKELCAAGFAPRKFSFFAPEYDSFSFVQSMLNRLGLRHNLLYNFLRSPSAKIFASEKVSPGALLISLLLAAPLGVLSLGATTAAALLGNGATITVFAQKQVG